MDKNGLIISPGDSVSVNGVETDLDSIGRGTATPIDGNEVRLTYTKEEIGAGGDYPLSKQ